LEDKERFESIKKLLTDKGPQGVTAIAKVLDAPPSSIQKYLTNQQDYFKLNRSKKWCLPNVTEKEDSVTVANNITNVLNSQVNGINALIDLLVSQLSATTTLISDFKPVVQVSSGKAPTMHPKIAELDKLIKDTQALFDRFVDKVPDMYKELIQNLDLYSLIIKRGVEFIQTGIGPDITALFLQESDTLSEETIEVLKSYQLEA
jgi:hypothetical protein